MMLIGAIGYALVISLMLRADLRRLKDASLRFEVLLPVGLGLQLGASYLPGLDDLWIPGVWHLGAVLVLLTAFFNREYLGFNVIAAGVLLNAAVILVNWGMPVSPDALMYLGAHNLETQLAASSPLYVLADDATMLLWFADVVPVPGPTPIRSVASIGDVLLMIGVVVLILEMSGVVVRRQPKQERGHVPLA